MDLVNMIPFFGGTLWAVLFFIIALSVIIAIHEYGHYIVGKKSGIFPEVFSLGFGPVLWSKRDRDGTKWQIAAIPFGGFVKFRGDANASGGVDGAAMEKLDPVDVRSTMHGAPLWARTATVAAGPLFNFVSATLIFLAIFLYRGVWADPFVVDEIRAMPTTQELQIGDQILAIEGQAPPSFQDAGAFATFMRNLPEQPQLEYTINRDGRELTVTGPYVYPPLAGSIAPASAAVNAGLERGDVILSVNGDEIYSFDQLKVHVEGSEGAPLALEIWRDGQVLDKELTPRATEEPQAEGGFKTFYRIGIVSGFPFEPAKEAPGIGEALWSSVVQVWAIISGSISALFHIATGGLSACAINSPIGIAEAAGDVASQGFVDFLWFIGVISVAVGFFNLLPIPALDGGHLTFYAYEAVSGNPPSVRALQALMTVGITVLLSFMIFAVYNDLFCP